MYTHDDGRWKPKTTLEFKRLFPIDLRTKVSRTRRGNEFTGSVVNWSSTRKWSTAAGIRTIMNDPEIQTCIRLRAGGHHRYGVHSVNRILHGNYWTLRSKNDATSANSIFVWILQQVFQVDKIAPFVVNKFSSRRSQPVDTRPPCIPAAVTWRPVRRAFGSIMYASLHHL